ncbi:MAG: hypothetical protein ACD_72C00046G0002 [uncultured bacterium]|nr:MAG: hypothetical protein ACD_72C00046G0002 [uncultured bacterium]
MKDKTSIALYNDQNTVDQYYKMQYGLYLKDKAAKNNLTESFYFVIIKLLKKYLKKDAKMLEVGCGLGRLVFESAKIGAEQSVGIDISKSFIDECDKIGRNERNGLISYFVKTSKNNPDQIQFQVADAENLPFERETFDVVVCLNVIDRVAHPKKVLESIGRVLKKGGVAIIADPYDWSVDFTPVKNQIKNMKDYFRAGKWQVLSEQQRLPFILFFNSRQEAHYYDHLIVVRKK